MSRLLIPLLRELKERELHSGALPYSIANSISKKTGIPGFVLNPNYIEPYAVRLQEVLPVLVFLES